MTAKPHHHGNLRDALISAGLDILTKDGIEGLSLRKAAAHAGVSHAAPAHHFDGKQGLLVAIAARGFERFSAMMQAERYQTGRGAWDQMRGICRGYLNFAEQHPALFQLIFTTEYKEHADPDLQAASLAAYGILSEVCALFEPSPDGPGVNELRIWSLVHGYATLRSFTRSAAPDTGIPISFEALLPQMTPLAAR